METGDAGINEAVNPGIHSIGLARTQQAFARHTGGRHSIGDFEQGSRALTQIGFRAVVAKLG
jgi:hypothetical protein